ncbi:MAG TPA: hypothetical protein DCQ45_05315 [Erysipelotrichaceae bacterium]|nr:hypothetical protein [Erysipelotrichaceae bacterium]
MKKVLQAILMSIAMAFTLFCLIGVYMDFAFRGQMAFTHYRFTKMVIGALFIGIGFGAPTFVYQSERLPHPIKALIHMGMGLTVYLTVAFFEGWIDGAHFWPQLFVQVGTCFVIYLGFVLYYRHQAKTLNQALQKKKH